MNLLTQGKCCLLILKDFCNHFRTRNLDCKTFLHNKFKLGECNKKSKHIGDFIPINFISKGFGQKLIFLKYYIIQRYIYNSFLSKNLSSKYNKNQFSFHCVNRALSDVP